MAPRDQAVTMLEALRHDAGLHRQTLSDLTGVSVKTIRSYEHADVEPTARPLQALATYFGVRSSVLLADIRRAARERRNEEQRAAA